MKDNNLNNTKNVRDIKDIFYKPEGQISKITFELLRLSHEGDIVKLRKLTENREFQDSTLNLALRNSLVSYNHNKPEYFQCLKLFLSTNIDISYKFPKDNNSTISMMLAKKLDIILLRQFLDNFHLYINNNIKHRHGINNNDSNSLDDDNELKEIKNFFCQKDFSGSNFFHHLQQNIVEMENDIYKAIEYLYEEFPKMHKRKEDIVNKIKQIIREALNDTNDEGNKAINICLFKGWSIPLLQILAINGYSSHVNAKKNNLVHSAVYGHNIRCLKIILYYCSYEELSEENCDKLTPSQLAYKLGYFVIGNIIIEYKKCFMIEEYKRHFYLDKEVIEKKSKFYNNLSIDLLVSFENFQYKALFYELNELKIIQNIFYDGYSSLNNNSNNNNSNNTNNSSIITDNKDDLLFKISLLKINWNILLTQIEINQTDYERESNEYNNNSNNYNKYNNYNTGNKTKKRIKPNNNINNSSNIINNNSKNNIINCPSYKEIYDLYKNNFSHQIILTLIDITNESQKSDNNNINIIIQSAYSPHIDILIFNKIIFFFKFGLISPLIKTAEVYLTKIFYNKNNDINVNYSWTLYVNISFILIEIFIYNGYQNLAEIIVETLEKYLYTNYNNNPNFGDANYTLDDERVFKYLDRKEILNPISMTWDETFAYVALWKILIYKDRTKDIYHNYKRLMDNCKYPNELPVFNRLQILSSCIEIKKLYDREEDSIIFNKLTCLRNFGVDTEIYYFNIVGIICLKKKKFVVGKFFFNLALNKYIQILKAKIIFNNREGGGSENYKEKFYNFRLDYIIAIKYNIFLCHFYMKEYHKCISILEQLIKYQKNYIFYYRLGLCYLQLFIISYNKKNNIDYYNKNILKLIGYEKNKTIVKKCKNEKTLSIDFDNDSTENLSYQFEVEYKDKYNNSGNGNNNIFKYKSKGDINGRYNDSKDIYMDSSQQKNSLNNRQQDCNFSVVKKIILRNTKKFFKDKDLNNFSINNSSENNINNIKTNTINNNNINNITNNNLNNISISSSQNNTSNKYLNYLELALKYLKKVILISKNNTCSESIESIYRFYYKEDKSSSDNKKNNNNNNTNNFSTKKKIPKEILIDTYLNILFCLSIKNNWLEMIITIKDFNNKKINFNKGIIVKVLLYRLEAYIHLNNIQKAKEVLNKLKGYKKMDLTIVNQSNNDIINHVNIKLFLYYTMILVNLRSKNYKEIDVNVGKIFSFIKKEDNIPYYIIDLLINIYLNKLHNNPHLNQQTKTKYNNIIINLIKNKTTTDITIKK